VYVSCLVFKKTDFLKGSDQFSADYNESVIDVALCSSNQCPECRGFCFDEEIISGWLPDESELTTRCPFCSKNDFLARKTPKSTFFSGFFSGGKFPPQLTIVIRKTVLADWMKDSFYIRTLVSSGATKKSATIPRKNSQQETTTGPNNTSPMKHVKKKSLVSNLSMDVGSTMSLNSIPINVDCCVSKMI